MPHIHRLNHCPTCHANLTVAALTCEPCELRLEGHFGEAGAGDARPSNEFSSLPDEDLHLLRIFVHCEGSIREMETALGVSYPTIKSRLAKLREKLLATPNAPKPAKTSRRFTSIGDVLSALDADEIDHAESLKLIAEIKSIKGAK